MNLYLSLVMTFQMQLQRWALEFNIWLSLPPTHALRPINPDNAWGLCITAAAGTELATPYSQGTVSRIQHGIFNYTLVIPDLIRDPENLTFRNWVEIARKQVRNLAEL